MPRLESIVFIFAARQALCYFFPGPFQAKDPVDQICRGFAGLAPNSVIEKVTMDVVIHPESRFFGLRCAAGVPGAGGVFSDLSLDDDQSEWQEVRRFYGTFRSPASGIETFAAAPSPLRMPGSCSMTPVLDDWWGWPPVR